MAVDQEVPALPRRLVLHDLLAEGDDLLDMPALGMDWAEGFDVSDELTGAEYAWGQANYVRLDPFVEPAHIFVVRPRR